MVALNDVPYSGSPKPLSALAEKGVISAQNTSFRVLCLAAASYLSPPRVGTVHMLEEDGGGEDSCGATNQKCNTKLRRNSNVVQGHVRNVPVPEARGGRGNTQWLTATYSNSVACTAGSHDAGP